MTAIVFECPPYRARLTESACESNRLAAVEAAAHPKREGSAQVLLSKRACVRCCGVVKLAWMWQRVPDEIEVRATPPRSIAEWRGVEKPETGSGVRLGRSIGERVTVPAVQRRRRR